MINNPFDTFAQEYDSWYDIHPDLFELELQALEKLNLPYQKHSIEIGGGSGRFSQKLNLHYLLDQSINMAKIAKKRNIFPIVANAENLPIKKKKIVRFYFLFSFCFIDNPHQTLEEIKAVNPKAEIVIMFINKDSNLGQTYEARKKDNKFYKNTKFFTRYEMISILKKHNFQIIRESDALNNGIVCFYCASK